MRTEGVPCYHISWNQSPSPFALWWNRDFNSPYEPNSGISGWSYRKRRKRPSWPSLSPFTSTIRTRSSQQMSNRDLKHPLEILNCSVWVSSGSWCSCFITIQAAPSSSSPPHPSTLLGKDALPPGTPKLQMNVIQRSIKFLTVHREVPGQLTSQERETTPGTNCPSKQLKISPTVWKFSHKLNKYISNRKEKKPLHLLYKLFVTNRCDSLKVCQKWFSIGVQDGCLMWCPTDSLEFPTPCKHILQWEINIHKQRKQFHVMLSP